MKFLDEFVLHIKQKKELSELDDEFIVKYFKKNISKNLEVSLEKYASFTQALRNKKIKEALSCTRKDLREVYGLFLHEPLQQNMLKNISSVNDPNISSLLQLHRSTEERLPFYTTLYSRLYALLRERGLPEKFSILDVASGFNPLALSYFPVLPTRYVACDLSSKEMGVLNAFFSQVAVDGHAFGQDVLSEEFLSWLATQSFDVVFFLKACDSFEKVKRHSSKKLLLASLAPLLVVSFPLVSIGGAKRIASEKRTWLERFCERQGWVYSSFQIPNELFYIIQK